MKINFEYWGISDGRKVGAAKINYKSSELVGIYSQVFRHEVTHILDKTGSLNPGLLDKDGTFYYLPLELGFLTIDKVDFYRETEDYTGNYIVHYRFNIHSKDYKLLQHFECDVVVSIFGGILRPAIDFANFINNYLSCGFELKKIDLSELIKKVPYYESKAIVRKIVDELEIEYKSASYRRIGRDDLFIDWGIIKNIPKNIHIVELLKGALAEYSDIQYDTDNDTIQYKIDSNRGYGGGNDTVTVYQDPEANHSLKDELKWYLLNNYDSIKYTIYNALALFPSKLQESDALKEKK